MKLSQQNKGSRSSLRDVISFNTNVNLCWVGTNFPPRRNANDPSIVQEEQSSDSTNQIARHETRHKTIRLIQFTTQINVSQFLFILDILVVMMLIVG
jgi:hypothetical protein